jgi:hypothetical protein
MVVSEGQFGCEQDCVVLFRELVLIALKIKRLPLVMAEFPGILWNFPNSPQASRAWRP